MRPDRVCHLPGRRRSDADLLRQHDGRDSLGGYERHVERLQPGAQRQLGGVHRGFRRDGELPPAVPTLEETVTGGTSIVPEAPDIQGTAVRAVCTVRPDEPLEQAPHRCFGRICLFQPLQAALRGSSSQPLSPPKSGDMREIREEKATERLEQSKLLVNLGYVLIRLCLVDRYDLLECYRSSMCGETVARGISR